jgi:hypothetical protein
MESTHQAITLMRGSGMIQNYEDIPEWMREKIKEFTCSLQSDEDGYIYHPQWGKAIGNERLGRDLIAAVGTADVLKFDLPYPTATERIKAAASTAGNAKKETAAPSLPNHLKSKEAFLKHLENLGWDDPTGMAAYSAGNALAAQINLIKAAGLADVMCDFLDSIQHKDTGLWGVQGGYAAINAFFKIGAAYGPAGRVMPNVEKVADSCMNIMVADELNKTVCYQFNAWWSMNICIGQLKAGGAENEKAIARVKAEMLRRAPECIRATTRKITPFKCEDGSYSYFYNTTCPISQGAIVAQMIKEGDVNATIINSSGVLNRSLDVLGLSKFAPKIYGKEGHDAFFDALRRPTK